MINRRVFVEKRAQFQTEANELLQSFNTNFHLSLKNVRLLNIYDVFNIEEKDFDYALNNIFTEIMVDDYYESFKTDGLKYIALETLPGQYDQRADSAMQCVRLFNPNSECVITCGKLIIIDGDIKEEELKAISNYLINPIESRQKDLSKLEIDSNVDITPLAIYEGFNDLDLDGIKEFCKSHGLAMSYEDLALVQDYFKNEEKRIPTETEIKVLDTYWSDHCRHTTFETELCNITFNSERFNEQMQEVYNRYLQLRHETKRDEKPITLMDMATINSRYLRQNNMCQDIEISDEINACSVYVDVDHDGEIEKWLVMFKNETHNHPTEIEPFGGASTCIGGAIRDPLSGRSYVYQAMRVTGSGNVLKPLNETLKGKLPQSTISKKAACGNSSYGNQIGLPTTYVKEIYHDSYVAKHLEVGAVVGATKAENVKRLKPENGDKVVLLGGRTGRDGIGGATGSSKEHNLTSLEKCASEVQKGNAPEERKIQRLFRNPECTKLIKKCNDFGAGGVCVAIGELADGLIIDLNAVRCKYAGLNATEIAISESQERMACVCKAEDVDKFIELANQENLEAYTVATVTDSNRLVMQFNGEDVVNISRTLVETAGVRQKTNVEVATLKGQDPFKGYELNKENILTSLGSLNVACQKGLVEMFDASIGSNTVMMPFGGKYQLTPTQASVSKIPMIDGKTNTCTVLTYGFNPCVMDYSCYLGAQYSILDSMAKTIACGGNIESMYFSFQEYFERLNHEPSKWGKVFEALLGTIKVQDFFNKPAIGGKDSMSGTFNDLNVVPTLISFACSNTKIQNIISPELKFVGNKLVVCEGKKDANNEPILESYKEVFELVKTNIANGLIKSCYVVEDGGILASLFKMSFGNKLGFKVNTDIDLTNLRNGCFVLEVNDQFDLSQGILIGEVQEKDYEINGINVTVNEALDSWTKTFNTLYPINVEPKDKECKDLSYNANKKFKASVLVDEVKVLVPVFPGTNCEYDIARAFKDAGGSPEIFVFRNLDSDAVNKSIDEMAALIKKSQIMAIPGGFSSGDEPDGSAKFIVNVLQNAKIKEAINDLLSRDGLILGICNGFQALIKSGLLPYGEIKTLNQDDATLFRNDINRHVSTIARTKVASNNSPWLQNEELNRVDSIAISHGEGKFVCSEKQLEKLINNGQIAYQYCDENGVASMCKEDNFNGSTCAIEGIVSECGHILGKMGHSERYVDGLFKNIIGNKQQTIFTNGVNYFKKEN